MHIQQPQTKSLVSLILATGLFLISTPAPGNEKQRLQQLQQDISDLRNDLSSRKQKQNEVQDSLRKIEKEIARLSRLLHNSKKKLKRQRATQKKLQTETQLLSDKLTRLRKLLSQQMRAGYSAGQQQALKLLLNQTDPAEAGRTLAYYGYFTQAQFKTIKDTQKSIQQFSAANEKLRQSTIKLESLKRDQQQQKNKLDQRRTSRNQVLAELNKEIHNKERRLEKLLADEKALAEILKGLSHKDPANFNNIRELKGKLTWPTKGRVRHNYGESRKLGKMRWKGVLISGREGQEIRAIAAGKVVFADWIRGYGLMIIVDHGNSYMSLYGHNQGLYKDEGDNVDSNETIAALGNSGGNTETGLYFELRHKGKPINPRKWFKGTPNN